MEEFNCHLKLKGIRISAEETSTGQDAAGTCAIIGTKNFVKTVIPALTTAPTMSTKLLTMNLMHFTMRTVLDVEYAKRCAQIMQLK